jgi:hypothetical protein
VQDESAKFAYQGAAYQFVGFDELTHFSEPMYLYIGFSRQRRRLGRGTPVPVRTRASANPGGVGHLWVKRRFIDERDTKVLFVPAKVTDNPGLDAADYAASLAHLPDETRRQLMDGDWGAFESQAFGRFGEVHLVDRFPLADMSARLEAMDYGLNGTSWCLVATDFDGNVVFVDLLYERDLLPDEVAGLVVAKRKSRWGFGNPVYADPSIWHRTSTRNRFGDPAVLADEFGDSGVPLTRANNDPRAGLVRLRSLIEPDPARRFPAWHPNAGEQGSPGLFVVASACGPLVEQLGSAPLQPLEKRDGGEIVDPEWESRHGHACAMARYAVMAKPAPSKKPTGPPDYDTDPDGWLLYEQQRLIKDRYPERKRRGRMRRTYLA